MSERLKKIKDQFEDLKIDAILIQNPINRKYISGFTGSSGILYISKNSSILFTDFRYIEQATKQAPDFKIINYMSKGLYEEINELIKKENIKILGFEGEHVSFSQYKQYTDKLNTSIIPIYNVVEKLRMIKNDIEINYIKEAAKIADKAFNHILSFLKPGITEKEIALELEYFMKKNGASDLSFSTIVASGAFSSLPHAVPRDKKLENGDFVVMDFGCIYKEYCSDMTRTVVIGKASDKHKKIYETVLTAQMLSLDGIRPFKQGKEIDKIARDYISSKGYGEYFGHGLGHAVGMEVHESPRFSINEEELIKPGMVMTVEPGIYIPEFGGVRIEDLVVITQEGIDNLTTSPKELIEI
ncbi:M24 family metallopeptidase [Defluviitalea phaphyphila]|uniref:M24 family metallopeptidase n=1 Tax=Defluviitalea phaphyphila TaxID=1473580 RepID=UPI000730EAE2|nr:Xaa-Pro peptidase family protein [Defluviitalea phaphyphila]